MKIEITSININCNWIDIEKEEECVYKENEIIKLHKENLNSEQHIINKNSKE